jgi:hypothetical protein
MGYEQKIKKFVTEKGAQAIEKIASRPELNTSADG